MRPAASSATSSGTGEIDMLDCRRGADSPWGTAASADAAPGPAAAPIGLAAQTVGAAKLKSRGVMHRGANSEVIAQELQV